MGVYVRERDMLKMNLNTSGGTYKKTKTVCVFHLGESVVYLANVCVVGIQPFRAGTLCSDRQREGKHLCVCVRTPRKSVSAPLRVHMCWCVHVCLYAVYSEQLDCQTGV